MHCNLITKEVIMEKTATLNFRVNPDLKNRVENILSSLGLSMSSAIDILKVNACWMLVFASFYFFGWAIYNRIKYDFKLEKSGSRDFILDKSIFSVCLLKKKLYLL